MSLGNEASRDKKAYRLVELQRPGNELGLKIPGTSIVAVATTVTTKTTSSCRCHPSNIASCSKQGIIHPFKTDFAFAGSQFDGVPDP